MDLLLKRLKALVRGALTCKVWIRLKNIKEHGCRSVERKKNICVEVEPNEHLVLGVCFAIITLVGLIIFEVTSIIVLKS